MSESIAMSTNNHGAAMRRASVPQHSPAGQPISLRSGLRYDQLLMYIQRKPSLSILEIGVARAANTVRMMAFADSLGGLPVYTGIDLFGSVTEEAIEESFCCENKRPFSVEQTMDNMRTQLGPEIAMRIILLEGYSNDVLPILREQEFAYDLIFIDGGHSFEAVSNDWKECQQLLASGGVIAFDDYPNWGVKPTIDSIDRQEWNVRVLEHKDVFKNHRTDEDPSEFRSHQLVEATRR